jgi:hypothetical protein
MLPRWLMVGIAVLVTVAWAGNEVLVLFFPGRGDSSLGPIFMVVVGAAFAGGADLGSVRKRIGRIIAGAEPETPGDKPEGGSES